MRRRRNAAASADNADIVDDAAAVPETIEKAASPTETSPPVTDGTESAPEAAPSPRRRTSTRRKATADSEAAEPALAEAAATPAEPVEAAPQTGEPPAKPKRTSTRRRKAAAEPEETAPTVALVAEEPPLPLAIEETPASAVETPAKPVTDDTKTRRPRGNRRGRSSVLPAPEMMENGAAPAEAVETAATAAEPVTPVAAATPVSTSRRTRGVRRTATPATTEPTLTASVPVIGIASTDEETAEAGAEGETPAKRRVRGQRRVVATAETTPPEAVVANPTTTLVAPAVLLPPVYQPLPAETLARLAEARVVVQKNVPELVINGDPRLPVWFFVNTEDPEGREVAQREMRLAYEAGVRIFTLLTHLPWRTRSGERRYDLLDEMLQFAAENAPDALLLPRLIFSPTASWERSHPDEMTHYSNGENGDVSLASRAFWEQEAEGALRAAVEHVAQSPHAGRVFGFYLEHGEWFHEKGRGYDISEANIQGFRAWLRARYKGNQVALRAAWHDGGITFDTAGIPPQPLPSGPTWFLSDREQCYADFHEYSSDIIAQVITRLGKAVKEASGGRSAVAVSYGYTLELARAGSGHLSLAQVLASPNIDILTGPISYSGRTPGGSAPLPAPVQSIALAGKLWVSEDDTKTYLSQGDTPDTYNPKITSSDGTWAAYVRNFGAALASGTGLSWMDLWGLGWLDDRELWQRMGRLHSLADTLASRRRSPETLPFPDPDVAVIIDERSFFDVRAEDPLLAHLIAHQRDALLRSGARVGFYLLSDLTRKNFPETPKLLLFLNAFHLSETVRTTIRERFQGEGRTLAWVYAPGCRESSPDLAETIGMQIRLQPWGSPMGTQILSQTRSPLTSLLQGQKLGDETRVNPSYYVTDAKAQVVGEYAVTGNPSLAIRKHSTWQSVFLGETALPVPLLRGLYRLAGIPTYTADDDVAWIGDSLLCLHSAPGGGTTVYLPQEGVLYDVLNDETLSTDGRGARLSMPPRGTRLLFFGAPDEIARLGGDPKAGPPGLTASELPAPLVPFVFEGGNRSAAPARFTGETPVDDITPEDAALMEAALSGDFPLEEGEDFDDEPPVADTGAIATAPTPGAGSAESADKKKRRRRRRGRSRGTGADDAELLTDEGEEDLLPEPEGDEAEAEEGDDVLAAVEGEQAADMPLAELAAADREVPVTVVPSPRARPSLEELLPLSEAADDTDLPPIPEEFLPLDPTALSGATGEEAGGAETARPARRPRRRSVGRRTAVSENGSEETGTAVE